jgi:hypothetical protein
MATFGTLGVRTFEQRSAQTSARATFDIAAPAREEPSRMSISSTSTAVRG